MLARACACCITAAYLGVHTAVRHNPAAAGSNQQVPPPRAGSAAQQQGQQLSVHSSRAASTQHWPSALTYHPHSCCPSCCAVTPFLVLNPQPPSQAALADRAYRMHREAALLRAQLAMAKGQPAVWPTEGPNEM